MMRVMKKTWSMTWDGMMGYFGTVMAMVMIAHSQMSPRIRVSTGLTFLYITPSLPSSAQC